MSHNERKGEKKDSAGEKKRKGGIGRKRKRKKRRTDSGAKKIESRPKTMRD